MYEPSHLQFYFTMSPYVRCPQIIPLFSDLFHTVSALGCGPAECQCCATTVTVVVYKLRQKGIWMKITPYAFVHLNLWISKMKNMTYFCQKFEKFHYCLKFLVTAPYWYFLIKSRFSEIFKKISWKCRGNHFTNFLSNFLLENYLPRVHSLTHGRFSSLEEIPTRGMLIAQTS